MTRTEAEKRAQASYLKRRRESGAVKLYQLSFNESEHHLYDHLKSQPNMRAYLIELIRKDYEGGM